MEPPKLPEAMVTATAAAPPFAGGVPPAVSSLEVLRQKAMRNWSVDEMRSWFELVEDGSFKAKASSFAGLSGKLFADLTEAQIKAEVPGALGAALFNTKNKWLGSTDDIQAVVTLLSKEQERHEPPAPPYQEDQCRKDLTLKIAKTVAPNLKAARARTPPANLMWIHCLINGISGQGKTRFCKELLPRLQAHEPRDFGDIRACKTLIITWLNGQSISATEKQWPVSVRIGARLLHSSQPKFPNWDIFVVNVQQQNLMHLLSFPQVVEFLRSAWKLDTLHVVIDEFQETTKERVAYGGQKQSGVPEETLSLAVHRVASAAACNAGPFFLLITYACTAINSAAVSDTSSAYPSPKFFALEPLDKSSAVKMLQDLQLDGAVPVLPLLGGNPRAITLYAELAKQGSDEAVIWKQLTENVFLKWNVGSISYVVPLLALCGLPVPLQLRLVDEEVEQLPSKGIATLKSLSAAKVTIYMPWIVICSAANAFKAMRIWEFIRPVFDTPPSQSAADYERLVCRLLGLRYWLAGLLLSGKDALVRGVHLFHGMQCSNQLGSLKFKWSEATFRTYGSSAGKAIWPTPTKDFVVGSSTLSDVETDFMITLGGPQCWIDALLRLTTDTNERVYVWIDAKQSEAANSGKNTLGAPVSLINNVKLCAQILPGTHVLCILATQKAPSFRKQLEAEGVVHALVTVENLSSGLSHVVSELIVSSLAYKEASRKAEAQVLVRVKREQEAQDDAKRKKTRREKGLRDSDEDFDEGPPTHARH